MTDSLCAVCGEHANEHGAIPHQFVARSAEKRLAWAINQLRNAAASSWAMRYEHDEWMTVLLDHFDKTMIPCNLPFERVPQHAADPGIGPVPPKPERPKVEPLFQQPEEPT